MHEYDTADLLGWPDLESITKQRNTPSTDSKRLSFSLSGILPSRMCFSFVDAGGGGRIVAIVTPGGVIEVNYKVAVV